MAKPLTPHESNTLKRELLEAMQKNGGFGYSAAKTIGIPYVTVHYWMNNDEEFLAEYKDIKERVLDRMEAELIHRATNDKRRDACLLFYLKTQGKHRGYVERIETTGKDGSTLMNEVTFKVAESDIDLIERIKQQAIEEYKTGLIEHNEKPDES
jgi:hypothetical protein